MMIRSLTPVAFLLLLTGCSVGPDYVRPEIGAEVPDGWAGQSPEPAPTVTMADALPDTSFGADAKTGGKPSVGQLIGRYLAYYVSVIPFCLGFIWVGIDKKKQGFHDKLAGTVVIRDRGKEPVHFDP